ncbi:MAG: VanZ family protein [Chloroflexi bacterium]|nr:VanZ family protein [Chloroflexota bacterium]
MQPGASRAGSRGRSWELAWLARLASIALLVTWAGYIFYLSSLSPSELPPQARAFSWLGEMRGVAYHFAIYGVLGSLIWSVLLSWRGRASLGIRGIVAAGVIGLAYGLSDEWHQSFTPGRAASLLDVAVDGAGALGAAAFWVTAASRLARRWVAR